MILVTAATAPVGRSIVEQLAAAMDGVSAVFLLAVVPGFEDGFLGAAKDAGVHRIVFQSSGAIDDAAAEQPDAIAAFHHGIEQAIRASGLEWTFLRLEVASADALQWAFDVPAQLAAGDVVRGPYADAAGSPLHFADLAAVAIAALTDDRHAGETYSLTGPRSLTHAEQIGLIGAAHGRELRYEELAPEAAREAMGPYAPVDVLMAAWERHRSTPAPVTDAVERVTGRRPRSVEQWAADYPVPNLNGV